MLFAFINRTGALVVHNKDFIVKYMKKVIYNLLDSFVIKNPCRETMAMIPFSSDNVKL